MVPAGYKGLLVCDTRRAEQWRAGLERAGFEVVVGEARSDKGSCEVGVPAEQELAARALVSEVIQGRAKLPTPPFLSPRAFKALVAIAVIVVAVVVTASVLG